MLFKEDNTFRDLRERSVLDWLDQMEKHDDLSVRGGVKVTKEYLEGLKKQICTLEDKIALEEKFLKKLKQEKTELTKGKTPERS